MSIENFSQRDRVGEQKDDLVFEKTMQEVMDRYKDLSKDIIDSLDVPQAGEYHNEGQKMKSHLKLMVDNMREVVSDEFDFSVIGNKDLVEELKSNINNEKIRSMLTDYVFLHDVGKAKSMQIVFEDGSERDLELNDEKFKFENGEYFYNGKKVKKVSYKGHGKKGGELMKDKGIEDNNLLKTVGRHDVGYLMKDINVKTYRDNYGDLDEDGQKLALTGLFLDLSASRDKNMKSNFEALQMFYNSKKIYDGIMGYYGRVKGDAKLEINVNKFDALFNVKKLMSWEEFKDGVITEMIELPVDLASQIGEDAGKIEKSFGGLLKMKNNEKGLQGKLRSLKVGVDNIAKIIKYLGK